jgi:hypothetical protein
MASVWDYSATPASNNAASPNGMPEGMAPSGVNDSWRQGIALMFEGLAKSTTAGGTADALTVTFANVPTAINTFADGIEIKVRAASANATTTPTIAVNGGTARTITKRGGSALIAGDIFGNLAEMTLRYNLANTRWELLNPAGNTVDPTTWTPVDSSGASLSLTVNDAYYMRHGKLVTLIFSITFPVTANGSTAKIGGLPANPKALAGTDQIFTITSNNSLIVARLDNSGSAATMTFAGTTTTATTVANSFFSAVTITGSFTYVAA